MIDQNISGLFEVGNLFSDAVVEHYKDITGQANCMEHLKGNFNGPANRHSGTFIQLRYMLCEMREIILKQQSTIAFFMPL